MNTIKQTLQNKVVPSWPSDSRRYNSNEPQYSAEYTIFLIFLYYIIDSHSIHGAIVAAMIAATIAPTGCGDDRPVLLVSPY